VKGLRINIQQLSSTLIVTSGSMSVRPRVYRWPSNGVRSNSEGSSVSNFNRAQNWLSKSQPSNLQKPALGHFNSRHLPTSNFQPRTLASQLTSRKPPSRDSYQLYFARVPLVDRRCVLISLFCRLPMIEVLADEIESGSECSQTFSILVSPRGPP
jgi:hypothetical protein